MLRGGCGEFPHHRGRNLIAKLSILNVYADESGIQGDADWCLVTGFIGTPRHWESFDRQWQFALDKFEVPEFHAKDFFARKSKAKSRTNYYAGWTQVRAFDFIDALARAVRFDKRLYPIGGSVHVPSFNSLPYGLRRALTGGIVEKNSKGVRRWRTTGAPSKPYFMAFHWLLVEAMRRVQDDSVIDFVFDEQRQFESRGILTFQEIKELIAPVDPRNDRLGAVSYASRKRHVGLQAADLHTHIWYSYLTQGDSISLDRQYAMDKLIKDGAMMKTLDERSIDFLVDAIPETEREFMAASKPPAKNKKGANDG
jgi:hypothetical protein